MRAAWAVSALALLAVCGGCTSEPGVEGGAVRQSGQDSYMATGRARGGNAGVLIAQSAALQNARTFCEDQGRRFIALADRVAQEPLSGQVTYSVRFRCPSPGSPELPHPAVNRAPDDLL
jgi:hypothetical protein